MKNGLLINWPGQKVFRQLLRIKQTEAEAVLWQCLRGKILGIKFARQFGIKNYVADFCCRNKKLIIELDGGIHDDEEIKKRDLQRTEDLENLGYKIIRFKNDEVFNDLKNVVKKIKSFLPPPQAPSPAVAAKEGLEGGRRGLVESGEMGRN